MLLTVQLLAYYIMSSFFFKKDLFILEREREQERAGRGAERISSRLPIEYGAWCGAQSQDPEIMTWAKIKSQLINWLSHPGALIISAFQSTFSFKEILRGENKIIDIYILIFYVQCSLFFKLVWVCIWYHFHSAWTTSLPVVHVCWWQIFVWRCL